MFPLSDLEGSFILSLMNWELSNLKILPIHGCKEVCDDFWSILWSVKKSAVCNC